MLLNLVLKQEVLENTYFVFKQIIKLQRIENFEVRFNKSFNQLLVLAN